MKITRRQLRKIINEAISGSRYYKTPPRDPLLNLPPEDREKLEKLTGHEDEEMQRTGYTLATTLQQDELVFPEEGEPYEEPAHKGDDYLDDLNKYEFNNPTVPMKKLGKIYGESFASPHAGQVVGGVDKGYYLRRPALQKAADICARFAKQKFGDIEGFPNFDISKVKPLIDAFTAGANEAAKESSIPLVFSKKQLASEISLYDDDNLMAPYSIKKYEDLYN